MKIPVVKPYFDNKEIEAVTSVLKSGWLVQGPMVAEFERMITGFTKVKFAKASSSCTTALHLALLASGIGHGDRVLVPSFTYVASANAIEYTGATPVFIDINPDTFNIDPQKIADYLEKSRQSNIKGIVPVHLFGLAADMNPIMEIARQYNLKVIEDAACALGTFYYKKHVGTFGNAGCFSLHPRKSITTGEGGITITNDKEIATAIESLRNHGASVSDLARHQKEGFLLPEFNILGYNYRMTDLQGAIGIEQMKKLTFIINQKTKRARLYDERLKGIDYLRLPSAPEGYRHVYQSYVAQIKNPTSKNLSLDELNQIRNRIMLKLEEKGIATRQGTHAVHTLGYYRKKYNLKDGDYPNSLAADRLSITLPLYVQMTDKEQEYVIDNLLAIAGGYFG
ncbi:MAG: DegT/DnrJ/EryC1/StrS family aminotransferase [Dehalococcoidales bacterium]